MQHLNGIRPGWTRTDLKGGALYVHLHDRRKRILRLAGEPELVPDGSGPILRPMRRMRPIEFDPAVGARRAVAELRDLVADVLPVRREQRWMIVSWLLTAFFLDHKRFRRRKPLLKFGGPTLSGKTLAMRLLCRLLYGSDQVEVASPQALFAQARRIPLLALELSLFDEPKDRLQGDFLLGASKGEGPGFEAERRPLALTAAAGIEPLSDPELIRWSWQVECSKEHHHPLFDEQSHSRKVAHARSRILSGIFELFAREVTPALQKRLGGVQRRLKEEHPDHPKSHADPFLALMAVILQALQGELHEDARRAAAESWRMVEQWIADQGRIQEQSLLKATA